MANVTKKPKENDISLPFAALQLLAPPVRLVSAALWKVMKQRDVLQYGVVEEFVTSACDTVPGLLTVRHQGKLTLGLRGRFILELCSAQQDKSVILSHLQRIRVPSAMLSSSAPTVKRDVKIKRTVEGFHALVYSLLKDPTEKELFFKEEFPVDYGPKFDQELEKLLWEFLIRLDQLLPAPNLAQTVSWLSDSPPVLEECAQAASQPQLLKLLLQHQACLGHLETAASLPPNMGDSILDSLSLPPSGRVPSHQPTGSRMSAADQPDVPLTTDKTAFIAPVIGLISNEDVPVMMRTLNEPAVSEDATNEKLKFTVVKQRGNAKDDAAKEGEEKVKGRSSGVKRKQPDVGESESEEEGEVMVRSGKKSLTNRPAGAKQRANESKAVMEEECDEGAALEALHLPEDPFLRSVFVSCLRTQPRVVIEKLSATHVTENTTGRGGRSLYEKLQNRRKPSVNSPTHKNSRPQTPHAAFPPSLDDKENRPVLPSRSSSPSQQRSHTETSGDGDDYVADSEDEATKNFKGRLFMKRYYRTKHGTYVPTLREYWKPGTMRRALSSAGSKCR